jgi:hypothetical protein
VTPNQVGAFQTTGRDWNGKPLGADKDLGERTKWALAIADLPRFRRRIVEIACARVCVREVPDGSNSGPEIDAWLTDAGAHPGLPWCAAFVHTILLQAWLTPVKTASAAQCLRQFEPVMQPLPGDLFGWVNTDGTGHVGFVVGFTAEGVATCEGNSNDGVRVCSRPIQGLEFRRVTSPAWHAELCHVRGAPVVRRQTEGTR